MIERVKIQNFKAIKYADIRFNEETNILVGDNGVGKSTIIEAISLALGYGYNQLEITPYLFHRSTWETFLETRDPPGINIEIFFNKIVELAEFEGKNNTDRKVDGKGVPGIRLRIKFDTDYLELFNKEKEEFDHIPCEYYIKERNWFSDIPVKQYKMPYAIQVIDSTSSYFNSRTNQYVARLIQSKISDEENVKIKGGLRKLKQAFEDDEGVQEINTNLSEKISNIKDDLHLSLDLTSRIAWDTILCPFLDKIPIGQIGLGEQCILKTLISLDEEKGKNKTTILFIEEPESHLSHTNMYKLLQLLNERKKGQLFVTTHNSFVANKLSLNNLILLNNDEGEITSTDIREEDNPDLYKFFFKASHYPTLRLALCKKTILVEGPTDEMVITYYYQIAYGKHPFDDGIELIVVNGVIFKRFIELASKLNRKTAVIIDNDGKSVKEVEEEFDVKNENIKVFTEVNPSFNTLEPSFVFKNQERFKELSEFFQLRKTVHEDIDSLIVTMKNNKTEWAFKLLTSLENIETEIFAVPQYIKDAIEWIKS